MKCNVCKEEISPKFTHSIKLNVCPFCGGEILDPALQKILTDLQAIMKEAEQFMDEVEEWFASNYSLRKLSNNKIAEKPSPDVFDDENFDEETIRRQTEAAKTVTNFQKRAGIKGGDMKSIVERIQSGVGAADPSEFVGIDPDYGPIDLGAEDAPAAPLTQKEAMAMVQAMSQNSTAHSDDPVKNYYEIEKLKKLQRQRPTGQGKFSRGQ